jgi:hypothetical protein
MIAPAQRGEIERTIAAFRAGIFKLKKSKPRSLKKIFENKQCIKKLRRIVKLFKKYRHDTHQNSRQTI